MQPFIGLQKVAISGDYLILLSKISEEVIGSKVPVASKAVGWNVYVLHCTSLNTIYEDFITRAEAYVMITDIGR
jgi:hypothetical protein